MNSFLPQVSIAIDGEQLATGRGHQLTDVTIEQTDRQLDLVSIRAVLDSLPLTSFTAGTPVSMMWGRRRENPTVFTGYVYDPTGGYTPDGNRGYADIKVLGAGMLMRDAKRRTWDGYTIPQVVREVAGANRFNAVVDAHETRWTSLLQDCSDWGFLIELAKKIGWSCYMEGTTIYFTDRQLAAGRQQEMIRVSPDQLPGNYSFEVEGSPVGGERRAANRIARYIDQRTGNYFVFRSEDVGRNSSTGQDVRRNLLTEDVELDDDSYDEALATFTGIEDENAWSISATLTTVGNRKVRPGTMVYMAMPALSRKFDSPITDYAGLWLVQEATHRLHLGPKAPSYTMALKLVRDGRGLGPSRRRYALPLPKTQPPARLVQGRWVSAWRAT